MDSVEKFVKNLQILLLGHLLPKINELQFMPNAETIKYLYDSIKMLNVLLYCDISFIGVVRKKLNLNQIKWFHRAYLEIHFNMHKHKHFLLINSQCPSKSLPGIIINMFLPNLMVEVFRFRYYQGKNSWDYDFGHSRRR